MRILWRTTIALAERAQEWPVHWPWRSLLLLCLAIPSVIWSAGLLVAIFVAGEPFDWWTFRHAAERAGTEGLYDWPPSTDEYNYAFRYSPLFAWLMVPITALGLEVWRLLHVAVVPLLPWRVAVLTLLAWPFWEDVWSGNVMTFVVVAGFLALRGNRLGAAGFLVLALLVPRPLMLPLLAWLWWKHPEWRVAGAAIVAVTGLATLATGQAASFLSVALRIDDGLTYSMNLSPSRFIGVWWVLAGAPLAAWLTWTGRVGWAALAISPYVLPYYLLVLLWEIDPRSLRALPGAIRQ